MTATLYGKQRDWSLDRDDEGHRTYRITWLILADLLDGPKIVLDCPQLPVSGSAWAFDNDFDDWAWCRAEMSVKRYAAQAGAAHRWWTVDQTFSTKPPTKQRCQDTPVEDPMLEPARISGGGVKYTEEATFDRFSQPLTNSSLEPLRGPQVEFDANRDNVKIEQNVGSWQQVVDALNMRDTLNTLPLWGVPQRCLKLSNVSWERQFFQKCVIYFKRTLTFDISIRLDYENQQYVSGFDKDLLDEGTKILNGQWDATTGNWVLLPIQGATGSPNPNPSNPQHYLRFRDRRNEATNVILNGAGLPAGVAVVTQELYIWTLVGPSGAGTAITAPGWIPLVGPTSSLPTWSATTGYTPGNLVRYQGNIYIAETNNIASTPNNPTNPNDWTSFVGGISNAGNWNTTTSYTNGQYVRNVTQPQAPGNIHVEKYNEADFTLLGVPVDFTVP